MLALAPQTRNKFKAGFRPGRKQKQIDHLTINRSKTQYLFYCYLSLTPLFGNALIRYSDLTFTYKKTGCLLKRQPVFLINLEKLFSVQLLLKYYCLRPKQLLLSRVLCAFGKQCRHSPFCSSPKYHPNHRY